MRIGEAAKVAGLTIKAIRFYESAGLLPAVERSGTYRDFSSGDIENLKIIARCRALSFSVDEVRQILGLVMEAKPACPRPGPMTSVVSGKLRAVRHEIALLEEHAKELEEVERYLTSRSREESDRSIP